QSTLIIPAFVFRSHGPCRSACTEINRLPSCERLSRDTMSFLRFSPLPACGRERRVGGFLAGNGSYLCSYRLLGVRLRSLAPLIRGKRRRAVRLLPSRPDIFHATETRGCHS